MKLIKSVMLVVMVSVAVSSSAFALGDEKLTSITWNVAFPEGDTKDFVDKTSFRGFGLQGRWFVQDQLSVGLAWEWQVFDWETDQLNLPLGIGFDTLIKLGPLPVKVGAEVYYYAERDDDFGPEWQLRLLFVPVLPAPEWSRRMG